MTIFDVLIIGGGPAGLSVATGLARQLHRAIVFDSGVYRNSLASHMHNVASWDHKPPEEFRQAARDRMRPGVDGEEVGFRQWSSRYPSRYPRIWRVLGNRSAQCSFHCLFCHGFEERGCKSAGVLAIGDMANIMAAMHVARMARRFAMAVTIYTHGAQELTEALEKASHGTGIKVDSRSITRLVKGPGPSDVEVGLEDGTQIMEGFLVHKPKTELNGPFAKQLGLHLTSDGDIKTTDPFYSTSVPGVFAAGDCAMPMKAVVMAMSSGTMVAGGLAGQLQTELYSGEQTQTQAV